MEELLIEFEKNGAVKSIVANYIWKWGCAIATIWYLIKVLVLGEDKMSVWIMFLGIIILLFILSFCISIKEISRKVHKKITIKAIWGELINQGRITIISEIIERYQKEWMEKLCKKRRINTTLKFEILLREIGTKKKERYIDLVLIGTLAMPIWERMIQDGLQETEFWKSLMILFILIIIISLALGWLKKEVIKDKELFNYFEKYADYQRLKELLIYCALKCKK